MFEDNRRSDVHDHFFRSQQDATLPTYPSSCCHTYYSNCHQHLPCQQTPSNCNRPSRPDPSCPNSARIELISLKIDELTQNTTVIKSILDQLKISGQQMPSSSNNAPTAQPLAHQINDQHTNNTNIDVDSDDSLDIEIAGDLN